MIGSNVMRCLLASTALTTSTAFMAGAALAADLLPVKAPPVAPPLFWNGCYIGANAGGLSGHVHQDVSIPGFAVIDSSGKKTGFTGGGQIGCNWQPDPNWVLGLEGDVNYLDFHRSGLFSTVVGGEDTVGAHDASVRWFGAFRARVGYVFGGGFLYVTGGLAISDVSSSASGTAGSGIFAGSLTSPTPSSGWTVGAGYEYDFTEWISAKVEYLHFDLGGSSYPVSFVPGSNTLPATWTASTKISGDIVRVGINFQLHR
jgi:outer membrane immunogenic protein